MNNDLQRLGIADIVSTLRDFHSKIIPHITQENTTEFEFFWSGIYSQWDTSQFVVSIPNEHGDRVMTRFNRAEQYMMWSKAYMFEDTEIAAKILASDSPKEQKALGRQVKGFDAVRWSAVDKDVVLVASVAKFSQDQGKLNILLSTDNKLLVEASPYDKIWGIGLSESDSRAKQVSTWQGTNKLGICLTETKELLREDWYEYEETFNEVMRSIRGH